MATYARISAGTVMELFTTTAPIATLFPPSITWVDVTAYPQVQVGWVEVSPTNFQPPAAQTPTIPPVTLAGVQAQLTALQNQVNAIIAGGG